MRHHVSKTAALLALCAALAPAGASAAGSPGGAAAPSATAATPKAHASSIATWFGPGLYGNRTACGQTLTPSVVGVANRTLPCGTLVKIAYEGRSLVVPVLDRGPYGGIGAEWDLTAGAAQALDISDTVRIRTRVVGRTANTPTLGLPPGTHQETLAGGAAAG